MPTTPTAAILSTGTEILQGLYPDTNAQWLSQQFAAHGIEVTRHAAVSDKTGCVADALRYLAGQCDIVIMTGGLGPTDDDLTRHAVAEVFGCELAEDPAVWASIEKRFAQRGVIPPASNRVQSLIPVGARPLYNDWGTAPGFLMEVPPAQSEKPVWFAALPGPPREMRPLFQKYLEPALADRFGAGGFASRVRTLHTFGVSESALNDRLGPLFQETQDDPDKTIALLAGDARVDIRLSARGQQGEELQKRLSALTACVRRRVPRGLIYGDDDATLESEVGRLFRRRRLTLAVAESCTGGMVAKRLTDISGSSAFFLEGWVTYTNAAKRARLGVRQSTLERHGAVSAQVARQMALGALKRSGADVAVSLTGVAGPTGGTKEKPVGLVWYGLAWRPEAVADDGAEPEGEIAGRGADNARVATFWTSFPSGREIIRAFASHRALDLARRLASGLPLSLPG